MINRMAIEQGDADTVEGLIDEGLTRIDGSDDALLLLDGDYRGETVELSEIDNQPGRLRLITEPPEPEAPAYQYNDMRFDSFRMARLAYGLWKRCGPIHQPEGRGVPVEVATDGQAAVCAYIRLGDGYPLARGAVAQKMDISKQTVSNYCSDISWKPGRD